MNIDFHYYATYCAAFLAGYTHEEALEICYSAQLVDNCSRTFLSRIKGPSAAATTQLQLELMSARTDLIGLQDITRIWASFHFLPRDLKAVRKHCSRRYMNKYRLICGPNGSLLKETVELASGKSLQAAGLAMHILADTWAHRYFAGTPSLAINNTTYHFFEVMPDGSEYQIRFKHSPSAPDEPETHTYVSSIFQYNENSIMNLGHGRAGHLPDYSFVKYKYLPAWADYDEVLKDNPSDYLHAFAQMVYAFRYLRGDTEQFETDTYAFDVIEPFRERIEKILNTRQTDSCDDWRNFGTELSGCGVEAFDLEKYQQEYIEADKDNKNATFLGKFILAALAQKSMVTNRIFKSGNPLAGLSADYSERGFVGIKDFVELIEVLNPIGAIEIKDE